MDVVGICTMSMAANRCPGNPAKVRGDGDGVVARGVSGGAGDVVSDVIGAVRSSDMAVRFGDSLRVLD